MTETTSRRVGRPRGNSTARDDILTSARDLFAIHGYQSTTLRAIAAAAGVDVALISHHFKNKRGLFLSAVAIPYDPADALRRLSEVPDSMLGRVLLTQALTSWDGPNGPSLRAAFRTSISTGYAGLMRDFIGTLVLGLVRERLPEASNIEERMGLVASQVGGILVMRHLIHMEPIASMSIEELVAYAAPVTQQYLTGPLP